MGEDGQSKRFHIRDRNSGLEFLVDTGAEISLVPATNTNARPSDLRLYAANNTPINTFGEKPLKLDFRLKRPISWTFCIAAVPNAIIGADFLNHFGLAVDVRRRRLIEVGTGLSISAFMDPHPSPP